MSEFDTRERWIVLCYDLYGDEQDPGSVLAAHGPFSDQHRALIWAEQHHTDVENGRSVCPATTRRIYCDTVRLEALV